MRRGGCGSALELHSWQVDDRRVCQGQNRTREIRPSGIAGELAETWAMVEAIRAHKAETPKQTSFNLRLCALHFYPDQHASRVGRRRQSGLESSAVKGGSHMNPLERQGHRFLQVGVGLLLFTSFEGFAVPYFA